MSKFYVEKNKKVKGFIKNGKYSIHVPLKLRNGKYYIHVPSKLYCCKVILL
jgi:hypothetical protein